MRVLGPRGPVMRPVTYNYVRVPTDKVHPDMTRYMCYRDVPETDVPILILTGAGDKWTVHRFTEDGYTYFMRPNQLAATWDKMMIARYASFGVHGVESVRVQFTPD